MFNPGSGTVFPTGNGTSENLVRISLYTGRDFVIKGEIKAHGSPQIIMIIMLANTIKGTVSLNNH